MRQLAGTLIVFSLISCAAATEAVDDADETTASATATTIAEVTVEGSPAASDDDELMSMCEEGATCSIDTSVLAETEIVLTAPFLEVRALHATSADGGSTILAARTAEGWMKVDDSFLSYFDDDPGCPSIEREGAIKKIFVEQGALVVVTTSDWEMFDDDRAGSIDATKARACRASEGVLACGDPTIIAATAKLHPHDDDESAGREVTFSTKYWVDADGEIETEGSFDDVLAAREKS